MKKTKEEKKAFNKLNVKRRLIILGSCILGVVLSVVFSFSMLNYSPKAGWRGNGKEWNASDNFDAYYEQMPTLRYEDKRNDGQLKIVQIADPQMKFGNITSDVKTMKLIGEALDYEQPDIAVVTGDLTLSMIAANQSVHVFANFMEARKQYWAFTYGNHDSEFSLSKYRTAQILSNYKYCLFDGGPSNIKGESNYFVKVVDKSDNLLYALSMIDSNMYSDAKEGLFDMIYDCIHQTQVDWYEWMTNNLMAQKTTGAQLQTSMFMHIPLVEFLHLYNSGNYIGRIDENPKLDDNGKVIDPGICHQGVDARRDLDGGKRMYDKIVELGSTKGVFVGHDHINTMRGFTEEGVLLAYGRGCGYHTYPFIEKREPSNEWLGSLLSKMFGNTGASLYGDEWVDENGVPFGRGLTTINITVVGNDYGKFNMYDLNDVFLFGKDKTNVVKQHQLNN